MQRVDVAPSGARRATGDGRRQEGRGSIVGAGCAGVQACRRAGVQGVRGVAGRMGVADITSESIE
jgi:hypothetical protein